MKVLTGVVFLTLDGSTKSILNSMDLKRNWLDAAIMLASPRIGAMRMANRAKAEILQDEIRRYDAASHGSRTKDWYAPATGPNAETEMNLPTLRFRARELVRNNAYAKRAIQSISVNAVGLGIRPTPIGLGKRKSDIKLMQLIKDAFFEWADSTDCDFDGQLNFWGLQDLQVRCLVESGEVLVIQRYDSAMKIPLQLQVVEPDLLDHTRNTPQSLVDAKGGYCIQGVQFNSKGKRIGYWLYDVHPGEGALKQSNYVEAATVLHVYDKERPGQVRGVPHLSASAISLRDFDQYEQAQLMRQKIASCFSVFITDADRDGSVPDTKRTQKVSPGMIEYVPAGRTVTFASPPTVQNYDEYATSILRKCAAGIGISYELLTGDLSNVNFSSGRMGWIETHRLISRLQMLILVPQMCDKVWAWFLDAAQLAGAIPYLGGRKVKCLWTPPRREMIDPVKETKALTDMIRAGLKPWTEAIQEMGRDPEDALAQIIEDCKKFADNHLMLTCDARFDATRTNGAIPEDETGVDGVDDDETPKQKKARKAVLGAG